MNFKYNIIPLAAISAALVYTSEPGVVEPIVPKVSIVRPSMYTDSKHPLVLAAVFGDIEKFAELLAEGKDVNDVDGFGNNALHRASYNGRLEIVQMILQNDRQKEDLNRRGDKGLTPLAMAAAAGRYAVCKALLEEGADPNIGDIDNKTALVLAAKAEWKDIVLLLLKYNATKTPNPAQINSAL